MTAVIESTAFQGTLIDDSNIQYALLCMEAADDIAVDTETSGLNVRNNVDYFMGLCVDVPGISCYMPFRHKAGNIDHRFLGAIEGLLQRKPLIWHNLKFDYHSLTTIGMEPLKFAGLQYDTMLLATLYNEELFSKELDYLAKRFLKLEKHNGDVVKKMGEIYGWNNLDPIIHRDYGSYDAVLTRKLRDYLWPKIVDEKLDSVYWSTELPFAKLLYLLEQRGVGNHPDFCERKSKLGRSRMATIRREIGGYNPNSPIDLKYLLLDQLELPVFRHTSSCELCKEGAAVHTHEGPPSFDKKAMEEYDDILWNLKNPTARLVSEYRGWLKAVTSLYEPILEKAGPDGQIRTEFHQQRTVTGRLSASNPNLQQVPRSSPKPWNGDAKRAFHSGKDGFLLVGWDYSQIELRLAAAYGREQALLAEFESDSANPFNYLAPLIYGVLTPETYHETKTFVYANLYGAGVRKIALQLGRPVSEVEELYANYKRSISGIIAISSTVSHLVKARGYVKYWDGRRRHMRNRSKAYKAWNSVIQGGAAQLMKKAMLKCMEFENEECQMVLTVHDEITFIIREDRIDYYEPLIVEAMTDWPQFGVRLAVEAKEWK